jgi:two-component system, sensor histidine kinase PdtaS
MRAANEATGHQQDQLTALAEELAASRGREKVLEREKLELAQRQVILTQEFEHRLINSVQLIASLLSLQSRATKNTEASAQLTIAARRVAALGRVHRQLHLLDHQEHVEFKPYLQNLCEDISGMLFQEGTDFSIAVEATKAKAEIPTVIAIPLGFIVNELITNAAKYARGDIAVRFETATDGYRLSVADDGPGLPAGFEPSKSKGLGMKIVMALARQIGGTFDFSSGEQTRGACFAVTFRVVQARVD